MRLGGDASFAQSLWVTPGLLVPAAAVVAFLVCVIVIRRRAGESRTAGQTLMLYGLLWLIVYDASFVAGYVRVSLGVIILLLLPAAYLSVQLMRWWGKLVALSHKPEYQRAALGLHSGSGRSVASPGFAPVSIDLHENR